MAPASQSKSHRRPWTKAKSTLRSIASSPASASTASALSVGKFDHWIRELNPSLASLAHSSAGPVDTKPGRYVAMDCEMVGVGPGGVESALARVTIVNYHGAVLLDQHVRPQEPVTDYRTVISGITPQSLRNAPDFKAVQAQVADLIRDRVVIGHGLDHDFQCLLLDHPRRLIRDTAKFKLFRKLCSKGRTPALRKLCLDLLQVEIQSGQHSPVEDAQAALVLYQKYRKEWEQEVLTRAVKARGASKKSPASRKSKLTKATKQSE